MTKTALITGASSGIGRELVRLHAANGGHAVITAPDLLPLQELKNQLETKYPVHITSLAADLTTEGAARKLFLKIEEMGIEIDYLINNAGIGTVVLFINQIYHRLIP